MHARTHAYTAHTTEGFFLDPTSKLLCGMHTRMLHATAVAGMCAHVKIVFI